MEISTAMCLLNFQLSSVFAFCHILCGAELIPKKSGVWYPQCIHRLCSVNQFKIPPLASWPVIQECLAQAWGLPISVPWGCQHYQRRQLWYPLLRILLCILTSISGGKHSILQRTKTLSPLRAPVLPHEYVGMVGPSLLSISSPGRGHSSMQCSWSTAK